MTKTVLYRIYHRDSGKLAASGRSEDCAGALRLTEREFRRLVRRARAGGTAYRIRRKTVRVEQDWREEAAREWDRRFGWSFRYPCGGCAYRSLCANTDWYCRAFAAWFVRAYRQAAGRLRERAALCQPQNPDAAGRSSGIGMSSPGKPENPADPL